MQRLALRIYETMDTLAEAHQRRLWALGAVSPSVPSEAAIDGQPEGDARQQLALVAHCLETGDSSPLLSALCGQLEEGACATSLHRHLTALEQTLIPLVDDLDTATFLWQALAQAREAVLQSSAAVPPPTSGPTQPHEWLARREWQVQTSTEMAQEIASAPALDELYRRVVTLVQQRLGYDHVQLFVVNRAGDKLIPVAQAGEAGPNHVDHGYLVPIGQGAVGRAAVSGQAVWEPDPRPASQAGDPSPSLQTPEELAVPITLRQWAAGEPRTDVVGVLDVRVNPSAVLAQDDRAEARLMLEGLCGQIALALESTRLREKTQESLHALEVLYQGASREGWQQFQERTMATGYRYDRAALTPLEQSAGTAGTWGQEPFQALVRGELVSPAPDRPSAGVAPLSVWGETFGVLGVEVDPEYPLTPDDMALLRAVSEQVAQALEGARLFDEEQQARDLLDLRVNELDCLNDVGRKIDQGLPVSELLEWLCARLPAAMQFPENALMAVQLDGQVYGAVEALASPWQMVQNLQLTDARDKLCIAYNEDRAFLDEESALLGDVARRVGGYIENRRMFEQTQRGLRETEMLLRVAQGLSRLDEQDVFEFVLPECLDLIGLQQGALLLIDHGRTTATVRALVRDGRLAPPGFKVPIVSHSPIGMLIETGRPVIIEDVEKSDLPPVARKTAEQMDYRSLLLVPIFRSGAAGGQAEIVGVLGADSVDNVRVFTEREVTFVQAVADLVSVAMENQRLFAEMQSRADEQALLSEAGQAMAACQDVDSLVTQLHVGVSQLVAGDGLYVALFDAAGEELQSRLLVQDGQPVESGRVPEYLLDMAEHILATGQPLVVRGEDEAASALGVPLVVAERMFGLLVRMSRTDRAAFDGRHRDLLVALSHHASLALQSVRLLEETRAALEEVEAAHRSYLRRGWEEHLTQNRLLGGSTLIYDQGAIRRDLLGQAPAGLPVDGAEPEAEWSTLAVPILLRGQQLGVIGIEVPAGTASLASSSPDPGPEGTAGGPGGEHAERQWTEDDYVLLQAVSEQLGQTLESARLFADTQRLAERERLIGEITAKIRTSTDMRDILETTAVELGRVLGTSRALVRLTTSGGAQQAHDYAGQE